MAKARKYSIKLVYRPGDDNDDVLAVIRHLDNSFFPGCVKEPLKETYWWLIYDAKGNAVGYAGMRLLEDENFGYFCRAGVLEAHRGQGLHKRLITNRIKMAKRLKWDGVITYVATHNAASTNALISRGFKLYQPAWKWAGDDFLYLKLDF